MWTWNGLFSLSTSMLLCWLYLELMLQTHIYNLHSASRVVREIENCLLNMFKLNKHYMRHTHQRLSISVMFIIHYIWALSYGLCVCDCLVSTRRSRRFVVRCTLHTAASTNCVVCRVSLCAQKHNIQSTLSHIFPTVSQASPGWVLRVGCWCYCYAGQVMAGVATKL